MMYKFSQIILILVLFFLHTLSGAQTLCFKSVGSQSKSIRLQLDLPGETSKHGIVKYENGVGEISIVKIKEKNISPDKTVPAAIKTEFSEIVRGKTTGAYYLITQGAIVGELTYKPIKKNKSYKFMDDQESYYNESCSWNILSKP
jgi:hypothetical protein